jgi:hypothetical protein
MEKSKKDPHILAQIAGWYGTGAIMLAYISVSFGWIEPDSFSYQLLNLTGAAGIIAIAWVKWVPQSIALNIFWGAIATAALIKLMV